MEYSRPLGWISRAPDGKFVVRGGGLGPGRESTAGFSAEQRRLAEFPRDAHHLIPSSQASAAGVRSSLRSEGSGQSARQILYAHPLTLGRIYPPGRSGNGRWGSPAHLGANQVSFSPASAGHAAIPTVYSPRDPRIRTSSPGLLSTVSPFVIEDLSSVNMPSSVERSFPSTVSSPFVRSLSPSRLTPLTREQSSSRTFQDPRFRHQFRPIQRINADARPKRLGVSVVGPPVAGPQTPRRPVVGIARESDMPSRVYLHRPQSRVGATGSGDARVWRDGRRIHLPGHVPLPPNYGPRLPGPSSDLRLKDESGDDSHRHLEVPRVSAIQKAVMTPRQQAVYQRLQRQEPSFTGWYERPLATSSPPRTDRRVARVPPSPVKSAENRTSATDVKPNRTSAIDSTRPKTVREDGGGSESSGSDHRPITYTRDRLIGVVERVRSSGLHHQGRNGQPFRNSAPELATAAREPTQCSPSPITVSPGGSPFHPGTERSPRYSSGSSPSRRRGTVTSKPRSPQRPRTSSGLTEADSTYVSDDALRGLDNRVMAPYGGSRSRASVTSGSSGRGSSGRASRLSHSRGDSLQGELEFTNRSSSSSGFASRTTAPGVHSDPQSPRLVDSNRDIRVAAEEFSFGVKSATFNSGRPDFTNGDIDSKTLNFQPLSTGTLASRLRSPLDLSVDENYEFDSASPQLECQIADEYSRLEPASTQNYSRLPLHENLAKSSGERGLSDSELYGLNSFPRPKRPSKYFNTEARCAALKEEFSRYRRRRQLDLDGSDELESAC